MLRKIVKAWFNQRGYKIIPDDQKYENLLNSYESILQTFILKDLPEHDEMRNKLISQLYGIDEKEAFYIINCLKKTESLSGDICEFGIAQGATSVLMAHEIFGSKKKIWLFDSFQGLPMPGKGDKLLDDFLNLGSIQAYTGKLKSPEKLVRSKLKSIKFPSGRIQVVPGFIEDSIHSGCLPSRVSFAFVDFDFYEGISIALNFLDSHMERNGLIVVDDYGYFSTGAKTATDEFLTKHKKSYDIALPHKCESTERFCILKKLIR